MKQQDERGAIAVASNDALDGPDALRARIRAVEAAVVRRDATFLREFDAISGELRDAGRKGLGWLAGGTAAVLGLLLVGALRPGRRAPHHSAPRAHARRGGWIAAGLPLLASLLAPGGRIGRGPPLPGMLGLAWTVAQSLRGLRSHERRRAPEGPPLRSVASLDLQRYSGAWFEYARLPSGPEERCDGEVVAHYTPHGRGLQMLHRCVDHRGMLRETRGIARPAGGPGRFEVSYAPHWLHWLPMAWADHCVLHVDADYRHAVVGTPDRKHLWLLSRAPMIERPVLQQMIEVAQSQGFEIERLQRTPQRGDSHRSP